MQSFDARAKDWDLDPKKVERAEVIARDIRSHARLSTGMCAFEYGCGTGLLSFALQPYLGHITLADSSGAMLEALRQKITARDVRNMTPVRLDLTVDPLPDTRFDLIYTLMTLHHITDTRRILRQFHALLKRGGLLCVADLDEEDGSFHGPTFSGHRGFDRHLFRGDLLASGFSEVTFATSYKIERQLADGRRVFPVFLAVASKP